MLNKLIYVEILLGESSCKNSRLIMYSSTFLCVFDWGILRNGNNSSSVCE